MSGRRGGVTPLSKETMKSNSSPRRSAPRLGRETKISIVDNDSNQSNEYIIHYDDIIKQATHENLLGEGRFGVVWKYSNINSRLNLAVKRISSNAIETNGKMMDLDVPIKLGNGCPFIIKYYGALEAESYIWILNEIMDTSLDKFYKETFQLKLKMNELFISKIAYSVLEALDYMKEKNLLHRDIKPSNILINSTGEVKVCDFGISGILNNSVAHTFKGSECYMPPEKIQISDEGYGIKADVWSLGISLIEITTSKHPFSGWEFMAVCMSVTTVDEPSPQLDSNLYDKEFCLFIKKCLFKRVTERSNCKELLQEPFITKYKNEQNDLSFIQGVISEILKK